MAEDIWDEMVEKYGIHGYDNTTVIINYKTLIELTKKAETLRFLFGEEGVKTANLEKIQTWRDKADRWDQYAIYDNDKKEEILVKDLITAYEKLEAVNTWFGEYGYNLSSFKCWKELEKILAGEA